MGKEKVVSTAVTPEEVTQEILEYAQDRYGEEFEVVSSLEKTNFTSDSPYRLHLRKKGSPNINGSMYDYFYVLRSHDNNDVQYADNYYTIYYRDMIYQDIEPTILKEFPESRFFVWDIGYSIAINEGYPESLEIAKSNKITDVVDLIVYVKESSVDISEIKNNNVELAKKLAEKKYNDIYMTIIVVPDEVYAEFINYEDMGYYEKIVDDKLFDNKNLVIINIYYNHEEGVQYND